MKLPEEFYIIETTMSESYASYSIYPVDQPGDPRVNFREAAQYNKKVRLLRCQVVEVMEEQK